MSQALLALLLLAAPPQATANQTTGACSPIVINSNNVRVTVSCGLSPADAKRLQDVVNASITKNQFTSVQVKLLVEKVDAEIAQNAALSQKLDRIQVELGAGDGASGSASAPAGILRDVLERTVQHVDKLVITLTRIESAADHISVYFDLINTGIVEYRNIDIFGGGSFGNGGSSLILAGQEVGASVIEFAGSENPGLVRTDIVPRVRYTGRIDFGGVYGNANDVDVVRIALSNNNLRPSTRATFVLKR